MVALDLKSEPQYEREHENDPQSKGGKVIGYSVKRSFSAKVREIPIFPKLVDDLLAILAIQMTRVPAGR